MTTKYVDNRATGANNGGSGNDAWQSIAAVTGLSAGDVVEFVSGSGPYFEAFVLPGNGADGNPITWNGNGCEVTGRIDCNDSAYQWTASSGGTNEYYLEAVGGGNPGLVEVNCLTIDGNLMINSAEYGHTRGAVGSLLDLQYAWGDGDSLGFNTIYIRTNSGSPADYEVFAAQLTSIINTNWRYHVLNDFIFSYANDDLVEVRGWNWEIYRCVFLYANEQGVNSNIGDSAKTLTVSDCLFYWTGHRAFYVNKSGINNFYNCTDYGAHVFLLLAATLTSGSVTNVFNCISANGEAGAIDKKSAAAVLNEDYNCWFPRMTASGGALGYVSTANWPTTGAHDIPPSTATTESDQANLDDPEFVATSDSGLSACDFHLQATSPCKATGKARETAINVAGEVVCPFPIDGSGNVVFSASDNFSLSYSGIATPNETRVITDAGTVDVDDWDGVVDATILGGDNTADVTSINVYSPGDRPA